MSNRLYPLKFEPIYQYRPWGGRQLAHFLSKPLPKNEPIGEAWLLSDREDCASIVLDGSLKGYTLTDVLKDFPEEIMGKVFTSGNRFPLLLKFLDCKEILSVQVHPSDNQKELIPKGDTGKTEAWVVLETGKDSRIYAGLHKGTTKKNLLESIQDKSISDRLHSFVPKAGDAVLIQSGTVHALKATVVFEVQENSDTTFKLYDWDRIDAKTNKPRDLQIEKALACIDFTKTEIGTVTPIDDAHDPNSKEQLIHCPQFVVWRTRSTRPFLVGRSGELRILVCIDGKANLKNHTNDYPFHTGEVILLPANLGTCSIEPIEKATVLEIGIPAYMKEIIL
ncbi:MAG TPA: mannose-6-phosphate isomerase [Pricia antarctica]|uniref:Mannose-6-phosphate isomerase n=2 Tax=root TaxID=1 RepID=A0A831VSE9_9FLAO|nr:mannose-6-phosphate isomerase [Pricia antarctica]